MDIKYSFFPDDLLLIQKFSGVFSHEDYGHHIGKLMQSMMIRNVKKILIDFRDVSFNAQKKTFEENIEHMIATRKKMNAMVQGDDDIVRVFWVDKPMPTAVAHLFSERFPNMHYHYCSSVEAIIQLLQLPSSYQNLEKIVEKLN